LEITYSYSKKIEGVRIVMENKNKNLKGKEKLHITLFGDVSLSYNDKILNESNVRSKKFWVIFEYLLVFRNNGVTPAELLGLIYPEGKSGNPANALKTLMHRIRGEFDALDYIGGHNIIVNKKGSYAWNNEIDCVIDVEEFEKLFDKANAENVSDDEKLACYISAIELYKGDFLQKSALEPWVVQKNVHYRAMYLDMVYKAIDILKGKNDFATIVDICSKAKNIDPFDENLYQNLILGLVNTGNSQEALSEYNDMTSLFYREFGVSPSKELLGIYKDVIKANKEIEEDLNIIKENLAEENLRRGPFFCEYEVFKDIYRLEVRAAARTGESVYLCLFSLNSPDGETPTAKTLSNFMDRLKSCINQALRSGDIFAQYSVSQFVLLLPLTTYENGELAIKRVLRLFNKQYHYCPLTISYSLQPLETTPVS